MDTNPKKPYRQNSQESLSIDNLAEIMMEWAVMYPNSKPTVDELTIRARAFCRLLNRNRVTLTELKEASERVLETSKFFPSVADIIQHVDDFRKENRRYLPNKADFEWKKNFPELLSPSEAERLGIGEDEVKEAKRQQLEESHPLKKIIGSIGKVMP